MTLSAEPPRTPSAPRATRPLDLVLSLAAGLTCGLACLVVASGLLEGFDLVDVDHPARRAAEQSSYALAAFVALGSGAATWLVHQRAVAMALRFALLTALVASVALVLLSRLAPDRPSDVLTSSDRTPLREGRLHDGSLGIEHLRLGFRLPHPDMPFIPAPWIEREAFDAGGESYREHHALWAFQGDATEGEGGETTLMVDLAPSPTLDEASLATLTESAVGPLERSGHHVTLEPITQPGPRCLRRLAHGTLTGESEGGHVDLLLAVFRDPDAPRALRFAVTVVSQEGGWGDYLARVELPCEAR